MDISEEMLMEVQERAKIERIGNLEVLKVGEKSFPRIESCTFIFMAFVLHEVPEPKAYLDNVIGNLKSGGKLAIIEWERKEMPMGPPVEHRLDKGALLKTLEELNLISVKDINLGDNFYGLLARKK
ncbi:hypothetical protein N752_15900 [Desulforamulus aquiferis]|nr:hypothetical protein N752_15900 [Desulforamulus aquiferis]